MLSRELSADGLRAVAVMEAAKGTLVLLVGFGLVGLVHRDLNAIAEQLLGHLHLNAAKRYPHIFLDAVARLNDARLWGLAALAALYSGLRFVEAYGLWRERRWAVWLGALSGGIYLPFEVYELAHHVTALKATTFTLNLVVVVYLVWTLRRSAPQAAPG